MSFAGCARLLTVNQYSYSDDGVMPERHRRRRRDQRGAGDERRGAISANDECFSLEDESETRS